MKTLSLIYAVSENHIIGSNGTLPWHLPADLAHFKKVTMGKPIIMGRKTFKSIGKPLPGRQNIVLTRDTQYHHEGVTVVHSLKDAIHAAEDDDIFVIGGAEVYKKALPLANQIFETRVHAIVDGDTFFDPDLSHWLEDSYESHKADTHNQYDYSFITYVHQ